MAGEQPRGRDAVSAPWPQPARTAAQGHSADHLAVRRAPAALPPASPGQPPILVPAPGPVPVGPFPAQASLQDAAPDQAVPTPTAAVPAQGRAAEPVVPAAGDAMACADELPDGLVVADQDGRVVLFNRTAARLTGTPAGTALGAYCADVLSLHDAEGRDWWKCLDPYGGLRTRTRLPERSLYLADGGEVLVTAAFARGPQGRVERFTVCLRDAVQRSRQERDRADLVSTVAHELRSPLTSVKGFTATLLAKWHRFNDDQKRVMLETVNADADRVTRLITELLDVSRIEAGRLEMRRQVVDLAAEARKIISGRVAAGEPEDRFRLETRGPLPELWLDPDKIGQILGNLVENAVRHGAGTVTVVVEPDARREGATVSVRDEGEGIPPEAAQRVFRQFWRGHTNRRGGTGLGLYIVKGLVEAHGGGISVQRAAGGGAEFRFTVPAGAPDHA